jgi:hypothetical protein
MNLDLVTLPYLALVYLSVIYVLAEIYVELAPLFKVSHH